MGTWVIEGKKRKLLTFCLLLCIIPFMHFVPSVSFILFSQTLCCDHILYLKQLFFFGGVGGLWVVARLDNCHIFFIYLVFLNLQAKSQHICKMPINKIQLNNLLFLLYFLEISFIEPFFYLFQ